MAWRIAGKLGWGGGPWILFFPPCLCEATVLQESVCDHGHQRVAMKTSPGSPLEVIKPEFLFQLLVGLFTNPSCFDGGG